MGFGDRVKSALGMGGEEKSESEKIAEDAFSDVASEVEEAEGDMEPEGDEGMESGMREWDSAYRFAEEYLEQRGFTSMVDFTNKCMAYKINQSPMYRDKIGNGVDTMNSIASMQEQLKSINGGNDGSKSMKQKAEELEAANDVIDQAQKLSGQEDEMVRDIIGLGEDLAQGLLENSRARAKSGDVDSNVRSTNEEM